MPTPDDYANNQPGLLQRGPTSLLPPIPPSQNDNDPTKTQVAAVPRVPPPTPRENRPPTPGDAQPAQPTPQQAAPYTPVPWHAQPPPPAPPTPPLGNWTTDQVAPWLGPHLATLPGPLVPNREPDGYKGNQPVYNLRPGEPGYTVGGNSNILTGAVSWLESRNHGPFGDPSTLGQKAAFQAQYGAGPQGITNYAQQLLRANPNATFGDFYAGYALGTGDPRRAPTLEDLRTRYPEAYKNLVTNFPATAGGGGALPGTPSGPQGPWTQQNLEANFAYRTGQLGQPGNVQLATVTSPNGQTWQVNARVAPQFEGFLNDLYKAGYTGMASSGGYNNRPIVGGSIPSEHAYGAAIDIGAAHNPLQYVSAGGALRTDLPPNVGDIAAKWGLKWGGTFHDRQDPMHFEVAALMTTEQIQAAQNGAVTTAPQGTRVNAGAIGINTPLSTLLGSTVAAPPQQYIPPQPREPQHWGREPEHDWTPGRMPTSHDIPNILGALLPIAIAGVLGGGGLGMIAAYAGYQNARNKGQLEEAKEQKTKWKDALEETTSRLKLQLLGAKGIFAEYGDLNDPRAKQELLELALKTDDKQLLSAVENGDMNTVGHLLNTRDKIFQDLSKTKDSQDRADAEQAKKDADEREQAAPFEQGAPTAGEHRTTEPTQQPFFPEGGAPAATPATAPAPSGGDGGGGPAAGTPQQPFPERGRPAPAAGGGAPAPSEPPPADGEPQPPEAPLQPPGGAPPAQPAAAPAPYGPEIESLAAGFVMGNTDLTGIPKNQQAQVQGRAAQLQNQLNAIPKNLQGQDLVRAVSAINPQMASTLNNLLQYRQGVPQAGETSGGQAGRMLPFWTRMIDLAHQADNTWNPDNYDLYRKSREDFRPGGAMGAPIQRSNKLLASTAAVLDSINEIERKSGGKINETELEAAINALITKGVTGTGEYSGLMGALRNFALESTAVSEAGRPTVTMADAIISAIPPSRTPADIRAFVKKDLWGAVSAIETAHDTWKQLPGNATTEPLGYRDDVFRGLSAVAMTLDPATGNIEGKDLPPVLRSVIPRAAPAPRPGEGGGPTTGGGNGEIIQNGWRYDAKTHQPLGPAQ